mgnify:CR=1 FL=1
MNSLTDASKPTDARGLVESVGGRDIRSVIATGNLLPGGVETFCVDINQAVVTKLADRGSHQALGIVTDVGLFVAMLAEQLDG